MYCFVDEDIINNPETRSNMYLEYKSNQYLTFPKSSLFYTNVNISILSPLHEEIVLTYKTIDFLKNTKENIFIEDRNNKVSILFEII